MDEGNPQMKSRGWQLKLVSTPVSTLRMALIAMTLTMTITLMTASHVRAAALTIRQIDLPGEGVAKILLDTAPPRGTVNLEYVRDIVQFSIQNATIYPAKILHVEGVQPFTKVFAYQYAPNLVRVRFSVDGKADRYQGKIKFETKGKSLVIRFPASAPESAPQSGNEEGERSLLEKVLGKTTAPEAAEAAEKPKPEAPAVKPKNARSAPPAQAELGGKPQGPSMFRSLFAMFLVVGGLGLVLIYLKRKKSPAQAKKTGDSWIANLLAGGKKDKAYIEVLANHALGPKQSITVVRIKEQQFVLGVTHDNVQLITQLDADEADLDLLEDPKVADSIGKMFGAKVNSSRAAPAPRVPAQAVPVKNSVAPVEASPSGPSFAALLQGSGAVNRTIETQVGFQNQGVRDQIRQRLKEMGNS